MDEELHREWTRRLLSLHPEIPPDAASLFVADLYAQAQADLDAERAEVDFQREE
ncbi:hypothetical protein O7599_24720 [Streptomyces sp. WMMC500]|uniref:hypothetical protein n=1 Tax=Streptomyces sp. WMMC500 TaxID=3015154 RepID=UPI00248C797B|nr:hypothetical protein [Streptomyces sp. WMMC500]WBB58800.1 hypothetical protein O7599_24720 [Streptomyces sp. WMMC500]